MAKIKAIDFAINDLIFISEKKNQIKIIFDLYWKQLICDAYNMQKQYIYSIYE